LPGDPTCVAPVIDGKISTEYRGTRQENQGEAKNWPDGGME
jgi:hypothetical protein